MSCSNPPPSTLAAAGQFSDAKREAVLRAIHTGRDLLSQFLPDPVVLNRLLQVARHSPSVRFMRPWNFLVVTDPNVKSRVKVASANDEAAALFQDDQNRLYSAIKLEGIAEAPVNRCITCDRERGGPVVLGRTHNRDTDLCSVVCAVQNPWLAAQAEGIGVGWGSIFNDADLRGILGLSHHVVPVAHLFLGHVPELHSEPELQARARGQRIDLEQMIFAGKWGQRR